jgi:hypothetical protein
MTANVGQSATSATGISDASNSASLGSTAARRFAVLKRRCPDILANRDSYDEDLIRLCSSLRF